MELCYKCDRLIDMKQDEGEYYEDTAYCHNCMEEIKSGQVCDKCAKFINSEFHIGKSCVNLEHP